ncbi:hypothetical protein QQP08_018956 [Theobroma cacao]|nr:hypothetical protein QQP08_018956 [Theobroma cacao]
MKITPTLEELLEHSKPLMTCYSQAFGYMSFEYAKRGQAWRSWNEDKMLIDPTIFDSCFHGEILRCIHVGLLCVQDFCKR